SGAVELHTVGPVEAVHAEAGRRGPVCLSEDDVGVAAAIGTSDRRTDDDIVEAVAVDVAGTGDTLAEIAGAGRGRPVNPEAIGAVERRDVDRAGESAAVAEDDVCGPGAGVSTEIIGADDDIVETVAVDVARVAYGRAEIAAV